MFFSCNSHTQFILLTHNLINQLLNPAIECFFSSQHLNTECLFSRFFLAFQGVKCFSVNYIYTQINVKEYACQSVGEFVLCKWNSRQVFFFPLLSCALELSPYLQKVNNIVVEMCSSDPSPPWITQNNNDHRRPPLWITLQHPSSSRPQNQHSRSLTQNWQHHKNHPASQNQNTRWGFPTVLPVTCKLILILQNHCLQIRFHTPSRHVGGLICWYKRDFPPSTAFYHYPVMALTCTDR